jgi:FkbM family methyltransferase
LKNLLKRILAPIIGGAHFQKLLYNFHALSLIGMNVGGGGDARNSGEEFVIKYIKKVFKSQSDLVIFDVGSNIGDYAILLSEILEPNTNIYCFEPSKTTFEHLTENTVNLKNIQLFNIGLGVKAEFISLYFDKKESGLASFYKRRLDHFSIDMSKSELVEVKILDEFCSDHKIEHIHFLKMDVEGNELNILNGAKHMIENDSIDFIQFEFGGCNIDSRTFFQDFFYLLKERYRIYRILKNGLYPIDSYSEKYEIFITTNYLAQRISL